MIKNILLLAIFVALRGALCKATANINVFEFHPSFPDDNFITIRPKVLLKNSTGLSICMRAIIWKWQYKKIFQSANLNITVTNYKQPKGRLFLNSNYYSFTWKNVQPVTSMTWNSVCVIVNGSNFLNIIINGDYVSNFSTPTNLTFLQNFTDKIYLGESNRTKSFSGQITDLNLWSRPITSQEIIKYSLGCDPDFVSQSKPEYVFWPEANITYQGNRTKHFLLPSRYLCKEDDFFKIEEFVIQFPASGSFLFANYYCDFLNGKIAIPKNQNLLDEMLEFIGDSQASSECNNSYWMEIHGTFDEDLKWLNEGFNAEILADQLYNHENGYRNRKNEICLYFDANSRKLSTTSCYRSTINVNDISFFSVNSLSTYTSPV
jgi:hypothetical protein